ncbi:hypothetical protein ACFYNL_34520 [Streptomyces sp. NPDC007808]|uniref:hypothetical protein n=1 Tax=Streptomyces sp. NPDC007808 TaxID=3364779 RepID=UPI003684FBE3
MQDIAEYMNNHPDLQGDIVDADGAVRTEMLPVLATPAVVARTVLATVAAYTVTRNHIG